MGGSQISPDGRFVAYTVQQANWDENEFVTQIWLANVSSGERLQLTSGKKSSGNPQWSPDSRRLAFTSGRDGKSQIYVISPSGGEAARLTDEENGVGSIAWSPDGQRCAISYYSVDPEAQKVDGMQMVIWDPDVNNPNPNSYLKVLDLPWTDPSGAKPGLLVGWW